MAAGRNRSFSKDIALEKAMRLYWKNGYANTSLSDLTKELGINKSSFYAAFESKEKLFIEALDKYTQQQLQPTLQQLLDLTQPIDQRLRTYLRAIARVFSPPNSPGGCFMVNSTCEFAAADMPKQATEFISNMVGKQKQRLIDFFTEEKNQGHLNCESSPLALALFLMSINSGIAVRARSGIPLDELDEMIDHAVQTFV